MPFIHNAIYSFIHMYVYLSIYLWISGAGVKDEGQVLYLKDIRVVLNPDSILRAVVPILLTTPIDVDLGTVCVHVCCVWVREWVGGARRGGGGSVCVCVHVYVCTVWLIVCVCVWWDVVWCEIVCCTALIHLTWYCHILPNICHFLIFYFISYYFSGDDCRLDSLVIANKHVWIRANRWVINILIAIMCCRIMILLAWFVIKWEILSLCALRW